MTQEELINKIEEVITSIHPYMENRLELLMQAPIPAMDIILYYSPDDTTVTFWDSTEVSKMSIVSDDITVPQFLDRFFVSALISMILKDRDWIKSLDKDNNRVTFVTDFPRSLNNISGIGCGELNIVLDFSNHPDKERLIDYFYTSLLCQYYLGPKGAANLSPADSDEASKRETIESLTKEEALALLSQLDENELKRLLMQIPASEFKQLNQGGMNLVRKSNEHA